MKNAPSWGAFGGFRSAGGTAPGRPGHPGCGSITARGAGRSPPGVRVGHRPTDVVRVVTTPAVSVPSVATIASSSVVTNAALS